MIELRGIEYSLTLGYAVAFQETFLLAGFVLCAPGLRAAPVTRDTRLMIFDASGQGSVSSPKYYLNPGGAVE
jgi:hypothetical protein